MLASRQNWYILYKYIKDTLEIKNKSYKVPTNNVNSPSTNNQFTYFEKRISALEMLANQLSQQIALLMKVIGALSAATAAFPLVLGEGVSEAFFASNLFLSPSPLIFSIFD